MKMATGLGLLFLGGAALLSAQESRTPAAGGDRTPDTSRSSMPAYRRTSAAGGAVVGKTQKGPMSASDCSGNAWRNYGKPSFRDEASCQAWARRHSTGKSPAAPARTPAP